MSDRELLENAAKAAELIPIEFADSASYMDGFLDRWDPLNNDGDALSLAVKLNLDIRYELYDAGVEVIVGAAWDDAPEAVHEIFERDGPRAVRRAIVRAAASIAESKGE